MDANITTDIRPWLGTMEALAAVVTCPAQRAATLRMYTHADAESRSRATQIFRNAIKKTGQDA